jgi:adenylate cyclase
VIKTIGDEVMIVGSDAAALLDWAVGFQELQAERPLPRIGIHQGLTLYRDGDYYGRAVNLASRITNVARPGSVVLDEATREAADDSFSYSYVGERRLKGLDYRVKLFRARRPGERER